MLARGRCGRGDRMKRREFIVLADGAATASQVGSIASVYLRRCDPGDSCFVGETLSDWESVLGQKATSTVDGITSALPRHRTSTAKSARSAKGHFRTHALLQTAPHSTPIAADGRFTPDIVQFLIQGCAAWASGPRTSQRACSSRTTPS
jgi:hypothetical protein